MKKVKIGIICPSEIAFRRFMPAIQKLDCAEYIGLGHANAKEWFGDKSPSDDVIESGTKKAQTFADTYGGKAPFQMGESRT